MKCIDCNDDLYDGEIIFDDDGNAYCHDCNFEYMISHENELDQSEDLD